MIELTRLNGKAFVLNAELIEQIESAPDTVITLTTGNNIVVKEPVAIVVGKVVSYRRSIAKGRKDDRNDLTKKVEV